MTDDDARALLGAYAVDALDDLERRAVERLVARDPEAARELDELRAVAGLLGGAVAAPPPHALRTAVLAAVAGGAPQEAPAGRSPGVTGRGADDGRTRMPRRRPAGTRARSLVAAAAAVVALAVPGGLAWQQHDRAVHAEERADLLAAALAQPDAEVLRGELASGGRAVAVLSADRAVLAATDLPDPGPGRTYQLWAMRDGVPLPAGLFEGGDVAVRAATWAEGDGLAVSVEPDGGSDRPTTDPVLVLLPS